MTTSNHVLTGAVIAVWIKNPPAVIALSYLSHFLIDALPHFGSPHLKGLVDSVNHWTFKLGIILEFLILIPVILIIFNLTSGVVSAWLVTASMVAADLPDLMWIPVYIYEKKTKKNKKLGKIASFHSRVQWHQYWGIVTELSWLIIMLTLIFKLT
jgi:hypothetical protein